MKSLCACPAASIDSQYSTDLPLHFIGYQYLLCLFVTLVLPQNHYPHFMIYSRYLHSLCEIPLPFLANQYSLRDSNGICSATSLTLSFLPINITFRLNFKSP